MSKDIKCPGCGVDISFQNILLFEEDEIKIEGIAYAITCLKCDTLFMTPLRMSTKATKKQLDEIDKKFEEVKKNVRRKK